MGRGGEGGEGERGREEHSGIKSGVFWGCWGVQRDGSICVSICGGEEGEGR